MPVKQQGERYMPLGTSKVSTYTHGLVTYATCKRRSIIIAHVSKKACSMFKIR